MTKEQYVKEVRVWLHRLAEGLTTISTFEAACRVLTMAYEATNKIAP